MLAHDHPTLRAINPTTWIDKTDYRERAFLASLHAFTTQRADLLAVLEPLAPAGWARAATITGAGRPFERTVRCTRSGLPSMSGRTSSRSNTS